MWTLRLSKQAKNFLDQLSGKYLTQVENSLTELTKDPMIGKNLKGDLKGFWSYRSGIYRIIYTIEKNTISIDVLRISHRKEVYEKLKG